MVVLPEPFTPTTRMTAGGSATRGMGRSVRLQDFEQMLTNEIFDLRRVAHHAAVHALTDAVQNFLGGAHADVRADQREFQFVQQIGVDLLGALQHIFQTRDQAGARLLHAAL